MKEIPNVQVTHWDAIHLKPDDPPYRDLPPILREEDLKEGVEVLIPSYMEGCHYVMRTERLSDGRLWAKSDTWAAVLEFDSLKGWVVVGYVNLRGVKRLLEKKEEDGVR